MKTYEVTITPYQNKDYNEALHEDAARVIVRCGPTALKRYLNAIARRYKRQVETWRDQCGHTYRVHVTRRGPCEFDIRRSTKTPDDEYEMEYKIEAVEVPVNDAAWVGERIQRLDADTDGRAPICF